jgi:hypothetical protein
MDVQLQHDPKTKQLIKDMLYALLYDPVQRAFRTRLDTLIIKNALLGGYSHKSFRYKGVLYTCDATPPPRRSNLLKPQLVPDMEAYLTDARHLNETEVPYVLGFLNQVLNSSNDFCDYLRVLPEALHAPLVKLAEGCPCHNQKLTEAAVVRMQEANATSIALLKARLVTNLLI